MTEHQPPRGTNSCVIVGCTGTTTTQRWVITEHDGKREIDVCWKHETGDIDPSTIEAAAT